MLATVLLILMSIGCSTSQGNINIYISGPIEMHMCDADKPLVPEPIQLCKDTPCGVNAECQERDNGIACSCPQGYEGDPFNNCTMIDTPLAPEPIKLCKDTPCGVNADCQERDNGIACSCPQGYEGDPFNNCTMIGTTASPRSDLDWVTVGLDYFIIHTDVVTWLEGRKRCKAQGLELLQANNITALALYLQDTYGDVYDDNHYWLGGRGDGGSVTWLSGAPVTRDEPWYGPHYDLSRDYQIWCLYLSSKSGDIRAGALLWINYCDVLKYRVLCG